MDDIKALIDYGYGGAITFEVAVGDFNNPGEELEYSMNRLKAYLMERGYSS